ncbi:TACO1 oxidase, partial [Bucco capensis]|nr:TACO1 oxidase [Bucco capensis]
LALSPCPLLGPWLRPVPLGLGLGACLRPLHLGLGLGAGHSRWSKVRNVKGPRDAARSQLFQRLGMLLRNAARAGGPDPSLNPALAQVLQQCKAHNMPKVSIQAAIQG